MSGEPWAMRPWEVEELTREEVFEVYLEPAKCEDDQQRTPRESAFLHCSLHGLTWLETERLWQERENEQPIPTL